MSRVPSIDDVARVLRRSDRLAARALRMVSAIGRAGGIETTEGLSGEAALRLVARLTGWEAREILAIADTLAHMPRVAAALDADRISFSQLRVIVRAVRPLPVAARAKADPTIAGWAKELGAADPEELCDRVDGLVARMRADLMVARDNRRHERSFLVLQARMDGGGMIYGEAPAEPFATICEAIDAAADQPAGSELEGAPSRATQRMDALVGICETSLSGGSSGGRPRPRILATIDIAAFCEMGLSEGARILASIAGRPLRLTPEATEMLVCDADIQPVWFDGPQPIAVGRPQPTIPAKLRTALVARDGGCRFPGRAIPAAWCDAHHIIRASRGGPTTIENLILLCRRHHRRIHHQDWRIRWRLDGAAAFRWRGRRFESHPRAGSTQRRE